MITISLCMIVKNEEKILERCLRTISDLMDEIIIVDTGSTDRTKEIAGKYTDKVYDFAWVDDFSKARNFAFSKATKEYIYSADADEVIDEENREQFRVLKEMLLPEIEVVQMYYCNQLTCGSVYNYDKEYRPKLFKRLREFVWIDPIHETVRTMPVVFDSDIEIQHMQEENHADRDLKTFRKEYDRNGELSDRLRGLYARELYMAGGMDDLIQAEKYFEDICDDAEKSEEEIKEAACVVAKAARMKVDNDKFYKYAMKVVASGACSEICVELGCYYRDKKDNKEAAVWFYNAAFETESLLDIHCSGDKALEGLAKCYHSLGLKAEAEEYERMAKEWSPATCT